MKCYKTSLLVIFTLYLSALYQPVGALTFEYNTTAEALAEVGWHDYYGYYSDDDYDINESTNNQSYASAYWDKVQYAGEIGISTLASVSVDPNELILSTTFNGSYRFEAGSDLLDYFLQSSYCDIEGTLQTTEFPIGTPCALKVKVSFPKATWTSDYMWQLYMASSSDLFTCGRDIDGDYSSLFGFLTAYAGEQIYIYLGHTSLGYADHQIGDNLGYGTLTINVTLTVSQHIADLNSDGCVNFYDFAMLCSQWLKKDCDEPLSDQCIKADLNQNGKVDINDLDLFTKYWLLLPATAQIP